MLDENDSSFTCEDFVGASRVDMKFFFSFSINCGRETSERLFTERFSTRTTKTTETVSNSFKTAEFPLQPTVVKWISHEWGIILQSSFLCHPLSGHGIDHEAISMWNEKDEDWDSCAVSLQLLCISRSRWNDGDHKNKSSGDTRMGVLCGWRSKATPDNSLRKSASACWRASEPSIWLHLNCTEM